MEVWAGPIVAAAAAAAALLTFWSGFGLGTLLLPIFALFLEPVPAVAATAVVHLVHNLGKGIATARHARREVLLRFGVPAVLAAFAGAALLEAAASLPPVATWSLRGATRAVTPVGLLVGGLLLVCSAAELHPGLKGAAAPPRLLPLGGLLSGFFGGLAGQQGAFRSAFLARLDLPPEAFVGTGACLALAVDATRIAAYGSHIAEADPLLVAWGAGGAFAGLLAGTRALRAGKVTRPGIRIATGSLLGVLGLFMASGIL